MIELLLAVLVIAGAIALIAKKHDPKIIMFLSGGLLLLLAYLLGKPLVENATPGIFGFFDIFTVMSDVIIKQLTGASFIIMLLFGYTTYMSSIKANEMTIQFLSRPLRRGLNPRIALPLLFIIGNLLCLIIPSASSLSVLLMSTLFPVLVSSGMSPLSVAAIIATSATIAPTPLGADNLVASQALGMSVTEYTFLYHAKLSIFILIVMAITHVIWQQYCDKKEASLGRNVEIIQKSENVSRPAIYAVLPLLPLLFMIIAVGLLKQNVGIIEVTLFSFVISISCEMIRTASLTGGFKSIQTFFDGMGTGFTTVVSQVVCALIFVEGLKLLGVINFLSDAVAGLEGAGVVLVLSFCLLAFGVGMLSGSGLAMFYAFVELIPSFAAAANISPILLAIPMQFVSHFAKSVSFVSPTVIIISSMMNVSPMQLVKRTSVPIAVSIILTILLSFVIY